MRAYEFRAWIDDRKSLEFVERIDFLNKLVLFCGKSTWNDYEYEDIVLEQFTGLYDKNGVKIYEGDIVKGSVQCGTNNTYGMGEIHWSDDYCGWLITITNDDCAMYEVSMNDIGELEIIGNIHERSGENDLL